MKIGLFTPSWPGGATANGITTATASLVEGLVALGHTPVVLSAKISDDDGVQTVLFPAARPWSLWEKLNIKIGRDIATVPVTAQKMLEAARAAIDLHGIEVLLVEETHGFSGYLAKGLDIPIVVILHGPWFILSEFQKRDAAQPINKGRIQREGQGMRLCSGVVAPSGAVLNRTRKYYGLDDIPHQIVPNAIEGKPSAAYGVNGGADPGKLLYVGRSDWIKGGDLVLSAFSHMIQQGTDATLTFVGPDRGVFDRDGSHQSVEDALAVLPAGVRNKINYLGQRHKHEIDDMRRQHGISIVASRFENFPLTALESLATGVATIAPAVGGIPEIIRDQETGILVSPDDAKALADASMRLIADPGLCRKLGKAARKDVVERFSPKASASQMVRFLRNILPEKG